MRASKRASVSEERAEWISSPRCWHPYPAYKPSGIEWLGEVPRAWRTTKLKHLSPSLSVGVIVNRSGYVSDEGVPFLYGSDIGEGYITPSNARRMAAQVSQELRKSMLSAGDLITVRVGAPGVTAVVPPKPEGSNCASVLIIRRHSRFDSRWLCYAMNSRIVRWQVELVQYGAAQEQFNVSHAVDWIVPTPSLAEQRAIAAFLDRETAKLGSTASSPRSEKPLTG